LWLIPIIFIFWKQQFNKPFGKETKSLGGKIPSGSKNGAINMSVDNMGENGFERGITGEVYTPNSSTYSKSLSF